MQYHITLSNSQNEEYILKYEIFNNSVAKKWLNITQAALKQTQKPIGVMLNLCLTKVEFQQQLNEMHSLLSNINMEGILHIDIPDLSIEGCSQETLNRLHEKFHALEDYCADKNIEGLTRDSLKELNKKIHGMETYFNSNEHTKDQYLVFFLDYQKRLLLEEEDYQFFDPIRTFGDLCLGYATVGKPLDFVSFSNDLDIVKKKMVRQQLDVSTEVCAFFNFDSRMKNIETARENMQKKYYDWCEKHEVQKYGYDYKKPMYRSGNAKIGKLLNTIDFEESCKILRKFPIPKLVQFKN